MEVTEIWKDEVTCIKEGLTNGIMGRERGNDVFQGSI
jgi:hypothetical protein